MPFFWRELMVRHGSIAGNAALRERRHAHQHSPVLLSRLLGDPDRRSARRRDQEQRPGAEPVSHGAGGVQRAAGAAGAAWRRSARGTCSTRSSSTRPGPSRSTPATRRSTTSDTAGDELSRMQFETPTPWNSVRHDAYTFGLAMSHFRTHQPSRRLSGASTRPTTGRTTGRYDRVLETLAQHRRFSPAVDLARVAAGVSRPHPHPDHHRSRPRPHAGDWNTHGAKSKGRRTCGWHSSAPRSSSAANGASIRPIHTNQAAATMASWLGVDWTAGRAGVGRAMR